jgi:hypothetical protein
MTNKQNFAPEEWAKIRESAMLASLAVTAADPSGLIGLMKALVSDFETSEVQKQLREDLKQRFRGAKPADITSRSIEALAEVARLLDAKAPGEATEFKTWLYGISKKVAEASKEGGFLGFGGVEVSDAEKATLDQVGRALNLPA